MDKIDDKQINKELDNQDSKTLGENGHSLGDSVSSVSPAVPPAPPAKPSVSPTASSINFNDKKAPKITSGPINNDLPPSDAPPNANQGAGEAPINQKDLSLDQNTVSDTKESGPKLSKLSKLPRILILIFLIAFLPLMMMGIVPRVGDIKNFLFQKKQPQTGQALLQETKKEQDGIILKVGQEEIFQSDWENEFNAYPASENKESLKDKFIEKLISDSIILQSAQKDGFAALDSSVFNSKDKDYKKRIELIKKIKKTIDEKGTVLKGSKVAIWVVNVEVGPLGYEKSKEIAFSKIEPLYNEVKTGNKTIKEAGDVIINDESLSQIDPAWQGNAYSEFEAKKGERITLDKEFDDMIWDLEPSEVTTLYTVKNTFGEETVEVMYMFAQVLEKRIAKDLTSYEDWLRKNRELYEITYY